jgi:ribosomal protein S6--L-glutamate ligase
MKKKLVIFALQPFSWEVQRIVEEARAADLEAQVIDYFDPSFLNQFKAPDYALFRGVFDHTLNLDAHREQQLLLDALSQSHTYILNEDILKVQPFTKKVQHVMAVKQGLPSIETYTYLTLEEMKNDAGWSVWPCVAKPNQGSCGIGVVKLHSFDQAAEYFQKYPITDYVFQELMEEGVDLRVVVVGEKIIGAMLRSAKPGNFVSNYSQGGTVSVYPVTTEIKEIVTSVRQAFSLEYGGIDLIRDLAGKWRLLEVNRAAQFRGFEQATKTNVAKAIVDYIVAKT